MSKLCLLLIILCATVALAGPPTFTLCSGKDALLQDAEITSVEPNWIAGTTVNFYIKGRLTEEVTGGHIKSVAYFAGFEVDNKDDNMCTYEGTPFKCPEAAGEHKWEFSMEIPSIPFAGTLTAHSDFKTSDDRSMVCLDLSVDL